MRMRKWWLAGISLLSAGALAAADWTLGRTETGAAEQAVSFADAEHGFVSGIGSLARTDNGGKSWTRVIDRKTLGDPYWINSVAALSPTRAVISGFAYGKPSGGIVAWTGDGGATWNKAEIPGNGDVQFSGLVFAPDRKTGYVIGNNRGLFRTADGGATWTRVGDFNVDRVWVATGRSIVCPDDRTVIVWRGRNMLVRSDDGGATWRESPIRLPAGDAEVVNDLYFSTPERGWLLDISTKRFETSDGGKTWSASTAPGEVQIAPDGKTGWAYSGYDVAETFDGGKTWSKPARIFNGAGVIRRMAAAGNTVFAVGGQEGTGFSFLAMAPLGAADAQKKK